MSGSASSSNHRIQHTPCDASSTPLFVSRERLNNVPDVSCTSVGPKKRGRPRKIHRMDPISSLKSGQLPQKTSTRIMSYSNSPLDEKENVPFQRVRVTVVSGEDADEEQDQEEEEDVEGVTSSSSSLDDLDMTIYPKPPYSYRYFYLCHWVELCATLN